MVKPTKTEGSKIKYITKNGYKSIIGTMDNKSNVVYLECVMWLSMDDNVTLKIVIDRIKRKMRFELPGIFNPDTRYLMNYDYPDNYQKSREPKTVFLALELTIFYPDRYWYDDKEKVQEKGYIEAIYGLIEGIDDCIITGSKK